MPVILAAVLGAVAGPAVSWLEHHRVPRIGGAILVLLGLVAIDTVDPLPQFVEIIRELGDVQAVTLAVGALAPERTRRARRYPRRVAVVAVLSRASARAQSRPI